MTLTEEPQESAADELAALRRRVAELEAQHASESLYRGFIEQSLDGIVLMDERGIIVEWNRKAEELIGLPRNEAIGQSGWDILNQSLPEDRSSAAHSQQLQSMVNQTLKTGRWHALNRAVDLVRQLPNGARRILRQTSFVIKTKRGLWVGVVMRDITARKQAEEALRQNAAHLALAQEIAHVGSWDWDLTTNTAKWSDEMFRIFGMQRDEFDGRIEAVADRVHPEDRARYDHTMIDSLLRGVPLSQPLEFRVILPDGRVRHLLTVSPMAFEENGEITRVIGTAQDITARKHIEEQLLASLREKEVLLKELHHRVKNNLQLISSLLDLQADRVSDPQVRRLFEDSRQRIKTLALVHEQLYQSMDLAQIDFAKYVHDLAAALLRSYGVDPAVIALQIEVGNVTLGVDQAMPCGQIINELVSNSLKHAFPSGQRGEIRIELHSTPAGHLTLVVGDNGIGLPDALDFRQTPTLGLKLVNLLTQQIKGTIDLDRRNGTTYTISFEIGKERLA